MVCLCKGVREGYKITFIFVVCDEWRTVPDDEHKEQSYLKFKYIIAKQCALSQFSFTQIFRPTVLLKAEGLASLGHI